MFEQPAAPQGFVLVFIQIRHQNPVAKMMAGDKMHVHFAQLLTGIPGHFGNVKITAGKVLSKT